MADNLTHPHNRRRVLTIDDLPDDILLEIFDFYVVRYHQYLNFRKVYELDIKRKIESWQSLVHVCRRWRCLVFGSPRRLNLQLYYQPEKSARNSLDVWPALPIIVHDGGIFNRARSEESMVDNVIARLEHRDSDRIRQIKLFSYTISRSEKLWTAMQVPFPELAALDLSYTGFPGPVLPDSFLGGFAPRLRYIYLHSIPFPGLPKLLLSTTHLVKLHLHNIPHSGYISPEAMATCLSMLTSLKVLRLAFERRQSYPDLKSRPFLPTRSVLPTLTKFSFEGVNEYLEEFVARIDAPRLYRLSITFFHHIGFDTPELYQFISRTATLWVYDKACLIFNHRKALVRLSRSHPERSDQRMTEVRVRQDSDWQLLTLAQICTLTLSLLLTMEDLYIYGDAYSPLFWEDDIENTKWLDLLLPFTAVKNLYLSKYFSPRFAPALQELTGERTIEVLPALKNVFLEGFQPSKPIQEGFAQFISARQLTNHPVAISVWDRDRDGGNS